MAIKIPAEYLIKDFVYLGTDPEQNKRQVIAIIVLPSDLMYRISYNGEDIECYGFELSKEPDQEILLNLQAKKNDSDE